jgi:hypothetical protein
MTTSTIHDDAPIDPDDELLVAYLDGELPRDQRTQFENRLLDEPELRGRLQQLQTGWDLLDALPSPTPNIKLVETTLELAVKDLVPPTPPRRSWAAFRYPLLILVGCLVAGVLAFAVDRISKRVAFRRDVRELAIAEDLDAYNDGDDLELMRQLQFDDQWNQMLTAAAELDQTQVVEVSIASVPIDQRESVIVAMPVEQRTQLYSRWERYGRLDEPTKERIRNTADEVAVQSDSESLLKTMRAYAIWRESLPAEMVDAIETTDGDVRVAAISDAIDRTMQSYSERSSRKLGDETIDRIYFALQQILAERVERLPADVQEGIAEFRRRAGEDRDPDWMTLNFMFSKPDRRRSGSAGPPFLVDLRQPLQSHELELIRDMLPDSDLETLQRSTGGELLLVAMMIRTWAEEAVRRKSPWPRREETTALQRYLEIPADRREELDLLEPKAILKELTQSRSRFSW